MKKRMISLVAAAVLVYGAAYGFDDSAYMWAVAQIETGCKNEAIGAAGERSKFQFMEATWGEFSERDFEEASRDERLAEEVFLRLLRWQKRALRTLRLEVTPENLYILHRSGYGNVRKGNVPETVKESAQRVRNLYKSKEKK